MPARSSIRWYWYSKLFVLYRTSTLLWSEERSIIGLGCPVDENVRTREPAIWLYHYITHSYLNYGFLRQCSVGLISCRSASALKALCSRLAADIFLQWPPKISARTIQLQLLSPRKSGGFMRWRCPFVCLYVCLSPTRSCRPLADWRSSAGGRASRERPECGCASLTTGVLNVPPWRTSPRNIC